MWMIIPIESKVTIEQAVYGLLYGSFYIGTLAILFGFILGMVWVVQIWRKT